MVFCQTGGRGVGEGSKKTILLFWKKYFFQRACRIILGPLKHVLHLVWSAFVKYTANRTALKVALYDFLDGPPAPLNSQLMEKVNHYNLTKKINFSMGPSVKLVLAIIDSRGTRVSTRCEELLKQVKVEPYSHWPREVQFHFLLSLFSLVELKEAKQWAIPNNLRRRMSSTFMLSEIYALY